MSDEQALLAAMAFLYLSECVWWLRRGSLALRGGLGGRYAVVGPSRLAGNDSGGAIFLNPLPPLFPWNGAFVCHAGPIDVALGQATDTQAIRRRLDDYRRATRALRVLCCGVFCLLLVFLPLLVFRGRFLQHGAAWSAITAACWLGTVFAFYRAHVSLLPGEKAPRWRALSIMLLTPTAAIRACDTLSRHLLAGYHPLAVAAALCDRATFAAFARDLLLDLRYPCYPVCLIDAPEARRAEQSFQVRLQSHLEAVVKAYGLEVEALLTAPMPMDPSHHSFCPRCRTQYLVQEGTCADCGGRPLQPFAPAATGSTASSQHEMIVERPIVNAAADR